MSCQHDAGEGSLCRDENNKDVFIFSTENCCLTSDIACVCLCCVDQQFRAYTQGYTKYSLIPLPLAAPVVESSKEHLLKYGPESQFLSTST